MVDLGFGGSIGLGFNGGDVRSVIKNATKDVNMSESKDKTILNSEDIKRKKVEDKRKEIKSKVVPGAKVENQPVKLQSSINDSGNEKINKINMGNNNIGGNFGVNIGGLNGVGDINNIKVGNVKGVEGINNNVENNNDRFINSRGRITGLKDVVDVDSVIEDLYLDVGEGLKNGTLANADVGQIKNLYNELGALDDNVVMDMIGDLATLYKKGLPLNSENLNKFKEYYPELKNVGYGFTSGGEYNMYQGGGFKEAMNEGSPTDLNKYGVGGKVAETVVNPLGEATTALDNLAQQIPQVDGHKLEDKLKKRLSSLTDEDIDRYYKRYKELTDQGKLKMYTTKVKGNTLVGQMWSAIFGNEKNGRKYQDVEGGFRQWMIDQVNNEVNGFVGDLMDAQYFDQNVGPNVGKMMMNIPGSAVKTTTAIARAITNPLDTVSGLWVLGKDAVEHVRDGNFKDSILGQRYGSWEALAKAMEQDPVGVASDILAVAEGGSSLGKGVLKIGKGGMKGASFTTYVLGAERTSEGLLKIANRLEKLEGRISEFGKTAGGASDMGMRQLFYGVEKDGKMVGGLVNGLEKRAGEGDNLVNKAAGYIAKTQQPMKVVSDEYKKIKEAGGVMDRLAQKITGKADAESKLFQAASPSINRLTRGIDYKNKKANMDLATRTIVESGYKPRTIEEWAKAHLETLNKKWKEFTDIVKKNGDATVKTDKLIEVLENHLKETGRNITANQRGDIRAIQQEIKNLKDRGQMTMMDLEDFKESINSETKNKTQTQKGDIYIRGLKKLSQAIGEIQNDMLSKAPDEVKGLKKQIGALLDTKDDVIKANVRNLKRKEGGGLIENYSRIAGVGDVIKGAVKTVLPGEQGGLAELGKGVGKVVLGKALGRAKDVDFLVKEGFKGLEKKIKNEGKGMEMKGKVDEDKGVRYKKDSDKRLKDEKDYEDSQNLAYRKGKSTDKEIKINNDSKVVKDIKKKAKNVGFITKIVDDINKKLGLNDKEKVRGYADLNEKTINLSKNPTDTTAQHEYFHAVFSVVDNKTKKYILGEAKKFLKEKLGREVGDIAAEEWLAESFGVYIRDKEIKLGVLDGVKGFDKVKNMVRDLFQRGYEWMQNYNMDRFGVNRLFNEIWGGNLKVDEKGALDLSYLFGEDKLGGNADMGLKKKDGLRYKKAGKSQDFGYTTDVNKTRIENTNEGKTVSGEKSKSEKPISELGLGKKAHSVVGDGADGNSTVGAVRQSKSANGGQNFNDSGLFGGKKKNGVNYIDLGDGKIITDDFNGKSKFSGKKVNLSKENKGYYYNLVRRINEWENGVNLDKNVLVGKTERGNNIILTRNRLGHIFEDHGAFYLENFIEAVNSRENQFWAKDYVDGKGLKIKGKPRIEMKVPGSDEVFLVSLDRNSKNLEKKGSYIITSFRESNPSTLESDRVRLKRTYHGSAADFKKFDSSHMGEGEGAQAHGWGHYVAVDRDTAKSYAEMKGADFEYKGKKLDGRINYNEQSVEERVANQIYGELKDGKKWDVAIKNLKGYAEGWIRDYERKANNAESEGMRKYYRDSMKEEIDGLKMLDKMKEEDFVNKGGRHLYNVEIPDPVKKDTPTGSNYLEEDGKITKPQMEKIYEEIVKEFEKKKEGHSKWVQNLQDGKLKSFRNMIDQAPGMMSDGKGLYSTLSNVLGGQKEASKFLESLGYDGIHYFGGRDGEAYVIFGDDSTKIKSHIRYKKDNTGKELSKGQQEYFKDSKVRDKNGNLIRVFKGVDNDFTVFDKNKIKEGSYFGDGIYFTDIKDEAESYGSKVMEGYLDIKKMFDFSKYYTEAEYNGLLKELGLSRDELQAYKADDGTYGIVSRYDLDSLRQMGEKNYKFNGKIITDALKKAGYDGIMGEVGDVKEFVVFDSNQFKNVDNLNPTKNADIRYKKDKLRPGEIDYGNKGLQYKGEISRGKVKEFLSKNMSKEELIRNIGRYDEAKKEFDVDLKKRAKELNGREVTTSIKMRNMDDSLREGGIKRIMEKQEKKGKIGGVRDIVRGTVIVEGKEGLKKALDKFYKEGQGVDDKYSFIGDNDMGYRDLSFVYYTKNGIPCEVQVNVPEMMVAKDGKNLVDWGFISKKEYDDIVKKAGVEGGEGHKMYEKYRDLNEERKGLVKLIDKKGEKNMRKEIERIRDIDDEMDRIEKESREYYKKFEDLIK